MRTTSPPKGENHEHPRTLYQGPDGDAALAGELSNASKACQRAGISRSHFYEIKEAYEKYGREELEPMGLVDVALLWLNTGSYWTTGGNTAAGRLRHPFELFLAISRIEHKRTQVGSPQTNGFCERFHRTAKEAFLSVVFRKTLYSSIDHLQEDLDRYLDFSNRERAHRGYRAQGRTPLQAFLDGKAAVSQATAKRR